MNGSMWLLGEWMTWSRLGFEWALGAGIAAVPLAAVVLVLQLAVGRWLSPRQRSLLWGIVLLRLLLPVAPESNFSLQNLWPARGMIQQMADAREVAPVRPLPMGYSQATSVGEWMASPAVEPATQPVGFVTRLIPKLWAMAPLAWLLCAVAIIASTLFQHGRFCALVKRLPRCDDARLIALWEACCRRAEIDGPIPIRLCNAIEQPAVMGLLRPTLLLPSDITELGDRQVQMIMWHELAHIRAGDVAANWLLVVARALHWWNPAYWLAATQFQTLREQACDAFTLRQCGVAAQREYSELLLTFVQRHTGGTLWRVRLPASMVGFVSVLLRKQAIRARLRALRFASRKQDREQIAVATAVVTAVAMCGLTSARTAAPQPRDTDWLPRAAMMHTDWSGPTGEIDLGPDVTRTYELQRAIDTIVANGCAADHAVPLMLSMVHRTLRTAENWRDVEDARQWARDRISTDGTMLTITAPEIAHADVAQCLQAWEQSGLGQVCIWTRMISDERDLASLAGVAWQNVQAFAAPPRDDFGVTSGDQPSVRAHASIEEYIPIAMAQLTPAQVDALVQAAQGDRRASMIQSPKVTMFNGQRATISDVAQSPFVVGVKPIEGGAVAPHISVVDQGLQLTLRAIQSADRGRVHLDGRLELSHIGEVRTASTVMFGDEITIQSPSVRRCRIEISSKIEDGHSLLLCCIPNHEQKKFLYVVLTATDVTGQPGVE